MQTVPLYWYKEQEWANVMYGFRGPNIQIVVTYGGWLGKGTGVWEVKEMFYILISAVVTWGDTPIKISSRCTLKTCSLFCREVIPQFVKCQTLKRNEKMVLYPLGRGSGLKQHCHDAATAALELGQVGGGGDRRPRWPTASSQPGLLWQALSWPEPPPEPWPGTHFVTLTTSFTWLRAETTPGPGSWEEIDASHFKAQWSVF